MACAACGEMFGSVRTSRGELARTCSKSCGQKLRYAGHVYSVKSKRSRKCEVCSETYKPSYHGQRTCGRVCGWKLRQREAPPRPVRYPASKVLYLTCQSCDAEFTAPRHRAVCGKSCNSFYARRNYHPVERPAVSRACAECGRRFESAHLSKQYCVEACASRAQRRERRHPRERARRFGVAYEPVNRQRVFERDGWRCGICKGKVNPRLSYPHDMSASLDHIIPMSLGGGHLYVNVQLAHLKCNVDKGAEGVGDQLALLG